MNDNEQYAIDTVRQWVWSGFYSQDDVHDMIEDILEDDVDDDKVRSTVAPEFEKKALAEAGWPQVTDCDRLDEAFGSLNDRGIIALQNAGYTMSDGLSDVGEELACRDRSEVKGYCFYHGQNLERAMAGDGLWLAFCDLEGSDEGKRAVASLVVEALTKVGLQAEWDGEPSTRIHLPKIDWKRRFADWKLSSEHAAFLPLPPERSFAETLQGLDALANSFFILENGSSYMQCGGSRELCTVEYRETRPDQPFRHYVFCQISASDEPAHIPMSGEGVRRQKRHCLNATIAAELFNCYFARWPWPEGLALDDITDSFT